MINLSSDSSWPATASTSSLPLLLSHFLSFILSSKKWEALVNHCWIPKCERMCNFFLIEYLGTFFLPKFVQFVQLLLFFYTAPSMYAESVSILWYHCILKYKCVHSLTWLLLHIFKFINLFHWMKICWLLCWNGTDIHLCVFH